MSNFKIEIKWIDGKWVGFKDGVRHESAGILEITDLCRGDLKYEDIAWTVTNNKLVGRPSTEARKISKRNQ